MSKLQVLIVDDEPLGRDRLRQLLGPEKDINIIGECADGTEAIVTIRDKSPDVVFLDIKMPGLDGFGVLDALSDCRPAIIFVTAHDEYAVKAFEAHATDYLLKPVDRTRLADALQRVRGSAGTNGGDRATAAMRELFETLRKSPPGVKRLTVRTGNKVLFINVAEIDWIQGADNYAELHVGKKLHLLRQTLSTLERELPANDFIRISRSMIVNINRVVEVFAKTHGDYGLLLGDGTQLTGSRNYRDDLLRVLGKPA